MASQQKPNLKAAGDGRTECRLIKTAEGPILHVSLEEKDSPWYMLRDEEKWWLYTTFMNSPLWDVVLLHLSSHPKEPLLIVHTSSTWFVNAWDQYWITRIQIGEGRIDLDCPMPAAPRLQLNVLIEEGIIEVTTIQDDATGRTVIELTDEILQNLLIPFHVQEAMTSTTMTFRTIAMFRQNCFQVEAVVARNTELSQVFHKVYCAIPAKQLPSDVMKAIGAEAMNLLEPLISRPLDRQQIENIAADVVKRVAEKYGKYDTKAKLSPDGKLLVELTQLPVKQIHQISFETNLRL